MSWTVLQTFNAVEALLWFGIGTGFLWDRRREPSQRSSLTSPYAGPAFIAFGLSDCVEILTGAWWRPVWLLIWKSCIVTYLFFFFREKLAR